MSDEKVKGARNEVKRLLSVSVIREVTYLEWLANVVMVKKANGKWRMCIDFTDFNKACSRDEFPLPRIDSLVDAAATSELMSLLDCYSGYLLLSSDASGAQECWRKLQQNDCQSSSLPNWQKCADIC